MSVPNTNDAKVQAVISYFKRVDAGDASYLDLFDDNVKFFFPKFGTTQGKNSLVAFGERIGASLGGIWHDIPNFNFIVSGSTIVVEGQEGGRMKDGTVWPDNQVSQGRFCSVFEFSGNLITRMYIYVDPDFPSHDAERILILHRPASEA
ncbi:nuclear transport factor 2 family protein [Pseudorhodoferax sp.]|uniref:nuclear transport factor 2 family protein n=1 Tax=Pseudorhodoferax sp. TaxID=1993553 RepID=UPI0039E3C8E9